MNSSKNKLPNIFEQYYLDENRLTNALMQCLHIYRKEILGSFLKEFANKNISSKDCKKIEIGTQILKKKDQKDGEKNKKTEEEKSIFDAFIKYENEKEENCWAIYIESKLESKIGKDQIQRHIKNLKLEKGDKLLILTDDPEKPDDLNEICKEFKINREKIIWKNWQDIYKWLTTFDNSHNFLLSHLKEYINMKSKIIFEGIKFPHGYSYEEAKQMLKQLFNKIRNDVKCEYNELTINRPKITDDEGYVWDVFANGNKRKFTAERHFTVGIHKEFVNVALTIPNSAGKTWTVLKKIIDTPEFITKINALKNSSKKCELWFHLQQRHSEKGMPYKLHDDGRIIFKLDLMPLWFNILPQVIKNKKNVNQEFQIMARYYLDKDKELVGSEKFADEAIKVIKAFKDIYHCLA